MICDHCQKSEATVHLSGWQTVDTGTGEEARRALVEHHFCEDCAEELTQSNPLLNPLLKAGPGTRKLNIRVVSVATDRVEVKATNPNLDLTQGEWSFLTSRFPAHYAVPDMEFEMIVDDAQLRWLQGRD